MNATVNIIDTAGQQEYTALRDQHLKDGKEFLLVFALNDRNTFEEVKQLREQILKLKDTKKVPVVICGNKCVYFLTNFSTYRTYSQKWLKLIDPTSIIFVN